MISTIAYNFQ